MRMELGGFALFAILVCGMIAVFLLGKDKSMPVGPLASKDCKKWVAQANMPDAVYYKDSNRLSQVLPDSNLTLTLESPQSSNAREFWYTKLSSGQFLVLSSHSLGKLTPSNTLTGAAAINEASMRFNNLQYEGAWTIEYTEPSKPVLTAKVPDLGTVTCKTEGCFFSVKENIQALPLDGQPDAIATLKAKNYFGEKLTPVKEACAGLRETPFQFDFSAQVAQFKTACAIDNVGDIARLEAASAVCRVLDTSIIPLTQKYL